MTQTPKKISRNHRALGERSRRQVITDLSLAAGLSAVFGVGGFLAFSDQPVRWGGEKVATWPDRRVADNALYPQLAIAHGQQTEAMVRAAVDRLGGIGRFIAKGDRVLLKPNAGWDRQPEQAANTGPEVVAAMVRLCRQAGAAEIWVSDVSLNDPRRCFMRSGIQQAAQDNGGQARLPASADFVDTDMAGELLKVWPVSRFFLEADKIINLPVVKHHSLCGCTLAMKNWYGIIGGQRNRLHQKIHTSIVDLAAAVRPTLTVMDATRILKRNGPTGGNLEDVAAGHTVIAGLDEVAIDAFCLAFLDLTPEQVPFLALAEQRGLGKVDWRGLRLWQGQVA